MKRSLCAEDKIAERADERQLCALYDISAVINSSDGIDERTDRVLTEAMRAVGSQAAGIALHSGSGWVVRYGRNMPSDLAGKSFSDEEFSHAAAAVKTRMPVLIGDVFADNRANAAFMKAYGIRSILAVPLGVGTGGCLFFHYPALKETFDPAEVDFAQRTGGLVSLALRNAGHAEERERLIEQAEKERGRLDVLLKEIPAAVIIAEAPSGKVIQANEQAERIWRRPLPKPATIREYSDYKGFHPGGKPYQPEEWPLARSILNREAVAGEEIRIFRGDGSEGAINVSAAPLLDSQERVIAGITVFYDITELRQIQELRAHWAALVESSAEAIISMTMDLSGLIRTWNKGAETTFGYSADEVIGRNISVLVPPDVPNDVPSILERIKRGERIDRYETMRMRKDGVRIYVSLNISPIKDAGGIVGASTIALDINRRRLAEEALKDSESKFRNIASAAQDAVILIDNEGMVGFWNDAATKIFGYASEEMMGKRLHSLIMPERYHEEHFRGFEAFRTTGQGRFIGRTYEIAAKRKDGTEFPVELSLAALKRKDKWNAIGIVRDITERKSTEEELKRVVDELDHSNKELEQFAYVASHDLQEPLRTVSSYVELLAMRYKGKQLDENADKYIQFAVEGTSRMSVLISDLLAYARVGAQGKQFANIEMTPALQEAINNLKKAIEENRAEVTSDQLPVVAGDRMQMVQLLQNLVANAIKFRKKDTPPKVRITAERKDHEWVIGVQDNGIGIEPRFNERIFTIFQRLHTKEEYSGTGIGLAICRRIVERHGGRIWVESKPGEGSTFYFTLPVRG